ncbi:MAG: hypothetical protein ACFUZC_14400 [Chthoniobacteraceae bacterium]
MLSLWKYALILLCCSPLVTAEAQNAPLSKNFWNADLILWGDGRPYTSPVKPEGPYPQGFRADFKMEIPSTGWYEVIFPSALDGLRNDLLLDGQYVWRYRAACQLSKNSKDAKAGNLWLTAGVHTLRVQRVGHPAAFPVTVIGGIELRPAEGRPEASVTAEKTIVDIVRAGEALEIKVTGGGLKNAVSYELLRSDLFEKTRKPEVVMQVDFPASPTAITKRVKIPCPAEGAFGLSAKIKGGKELLLSEFPVDVYGVVDVKNVKQASGKLQVLHQVDCVAQTDNGQPIPEGSFLECNGPTQIRESQAGKYRESHDCTPPGAEPMIASDDPHSFSGFSYTLDLPEVQVPYLVDIVFPDDDRRSVTISQNWVNEKTNEFSKGTSYSAKGYETGGMQPLSNEMCHHRAIVWSASRKLILGILSQQKGHRAAVAKITISRFEDDTVPAAKAQTSGGRTFCHWYEEANNWRYLVNVNSKYPAGLVHDMVGLERWIRLCRYFGMNGLSACGIGYQTAFWRPTTLEGFGPLTYDQCRLAALLCEKYGMTYTPEVYGAQGYINAITLPGLAAKPEDVRSFSCHGAEKGPAASICDMNPLHPAVQKLWIDALGELSDKLRDCPSFRGITVRADSWGFRGEYIFPGLNWGYGDWITRRFEKDTGLKVPGQEGSPQRFIQRYEFLTSSAVKDQWVKWRCDGILDYHKRLRDRIRGNRHDLFFGVVGDFRCDPVFDLPGSVAERALGCGVDIERLKTEDGLAVIPYARYGFRSNGVKEQGIYDDFLDPENVDAGIGAIRGFSAYMNYQELASNWPAEKLGVNIAPRKGPYYCSAALASGRNSLEKFAVVLAEQDTAFLRDGGNTDIYGDPEIWNPWFAEYRALPALPFRAFDAALDPVAVWSREIRKTDGFDPGLYFYAVNREQYPVRIDLTLQGGGKITRLGTGEAVAPRAGVLSLELQPYELRSFRTGLGAKIIEAHTTVPPEKIAAVRKRLAFAQDIAGSIAGPDGSAVSEKEKTAFFKQLDIAWDAYQQGHLWRTRTAVSMAPALRVYEALAKLPEGQVVTAFPGLLQGRPKEGHWRPIRPVRTGDSLASWIPAETGVTSKPSTEINPDWGGSQVFMSANGTMAFELEIPADGLYSLKIGHVAKEKGVTTLSIDGSSLATPAVTHAANAPETFAFPAIPLKTGKARLTLHREGEFGIYALQLVPSVKPMPNAAWSVMGPFKSFWGLEGGGRAQTNEAIIQGLETPFIPEDKVDINATVQNAYGQTLRWLQKKDSTVSEVDDLVLAMSSRAGSSQYDIDYAVTFIHSDADKTAQLKLAVNWFAMAYLNGEKILSDIDPKFRMQNGNAEFVTWYPYTGILHLKKGINTLLVKQHGGSQGSAMAAYITDDPGLVCSPKPDSAE